MLIFNKNQHNGITRIELDLIILLLGNFFSLAIL
jgi:hypothetical protein